MAPFGTPGFTVETPFHNGIPVVTHGATAIALSEVTSRKLLRSGTWMKTAGNRLVACFDLEKGITTIA